MRSAPKGKREVKRQRTRDALRRCGLERFRRFGYEGTSVAEIARDAGVTERTFYRHFPSKEEILFQDHEIRFEWFGAALAQRPVHEPVLDSVRVAIEAFPADREVVRQVVQLRESLLSKEMIESHLDRAQSAIAREIQAYLANRLSASPGVADVELAAATLARAISGALLAALEVWGRRGGGDTDPLREITRQALALLTELPPELTKPGKTA
jgi:AcrR family transcriptional regulator